MLIAGSRSRGTSAADEWSAPARVSAVLAAPKPAAGTTSFRRSQLCSVDAVDETQSRSWAGWTCRLRTACADERHSNADVPELKWLMRTSPRASPESTWLACTHRDKTEAEWCSSTCSHRCSPRCHTRTVASDEQESARRPSSHKMTDRIMSVWPCRRRLLRRSRGSHRRTSVSTEPVASSVPSALQSSA